MNVVPHSTMNTNGKRELTLKCETHEKNPLCVSPSKGNQGITRGTCKEKILLTSVGIEPSTSGLDLPLFCQLSYKVRQ